MYFIYCPALTKYNISCIFIFEYIIYTICETVHDFLSRVSTPVRGNVALVARGALQLLHCVNRITISFRYSTSINAKIFPARALQ